MQKIHPKASHDDLFCPWDDDREMELVGITAALPQISQQPKQTITHFQTKKAEKEQPTKTIQQQAKKTLLHIDEHEKSKKMQLLKDYIDRKKESVRKKQNEIPFGLSQFKLPPISSRKQALHLKQSSKKYLEEAMSELVENTGQADNAEEHIFRKYGQHKGRQKATSVERSYSLGHQPFKIQHQASQCKKKYETLDVSSVRDKRSQQIQLGDLQLKGKKYSYDSRSRDRRADLVSYVPTQQNITPHYMLFGHNKEDILKKVLQQLHHKFKQVN